MTKRFFTPFLFLLLYNITLFPTVKFNVQEIDKKTDLIKVFFDLSNQELLYKDSINFSIDTPDMRLSDWHSNQEPVSQYDKASNETKIVFDKPITITLHAIKNNQSIIDEANIYLTYQTNKQSSPVQKIFKLPTKKPTNDTTLQEYFNNKSNNPHTDKQLKENQNENIIHSSKETWTSSLSNLVEHTDSMPMRLSLVFLLGILLSLTPCIYPMIPITAGILHAQQGSSLVYNFLLSLAYTFGISTTFACFGLLASYTGPIYGKLLVHPVSVIILISFLLYIALSLFGFYNLYIPTSLQQQQTSNKGGSLLSCFLFGVVSGSIASPCISPGLILLLSIVATLGNSLLGFLLLFFFGIGLSTPLLIVGTFSNSLNLLPKAGMWMEEVKKIFGIMLLGVCFYYLNNIVPLSTIYYLIAVTSLLVGIYYLYAASKSGTKRLQRFHNLFGSFLIISSIVGFAYTYQSTLSGKITEKKSPLNWHTDYKFALDQAKTEHKLLFIDFWAEYCSICKSIDTTLLSETSVVKTLQEIIPVKVNGTNDSEEPYKSLKEKFKVVGFPTFLLVEPTTQKVLKSWNSDLYHTSQEEFIATINQEVNKHNEQ